MRKKDWISLLAAVSIGLFSCAHDDAASEKTPDDIVSGGESSGYIALRLSDTEESDETLTVSRASIHKEYDDEYVHYEWFNRGSENERAIIDNPECNRLLFFYADNSFAGSSKMQSVPEAGKNVYVARKPAGMLGLPTQVLAVVNGDPARLDTATGSLSDAGTEAVKNVLNYLNVLDPANPESTAMYSEDGKDYFTMSSSIYMDGDGTVAGVTVKEDIQFFETVEEAVLPENLTKFYVERVLAKFTVRVQDGEVSFGNGDAIVVKGANKIKIRTEYQVETGNNKDVMSGWHVNLANWGVNAIEKNTYMFKTLVQAPASYPWDVADFYSRWNEPRLFRSYWAIDENYDKGIYPDQYRRALDVEGVNAATNNTIYDEGYADNGLEQRDYTLIYHSYNAFVSGNRADHKYSVENTFDETILADKDLSTSPWLRCGTHVILAAQLLIDDIDKDIDTSDVDKDGFIANVTDKYFSNGLYWSEKALIQQAVSTLLSNLYYSDEQLGLKDVLKGGNEKIELINSDENPLDAATPLVAADGTPITVENAQKYFELKPAFIKGGDGWVTIRLKEGETLSSKHQNGSTKQIDERQLVSYIYRFTNLAKHFAEGRMYYALPVKHNVESKNFEKVTGKVSTGDYGVVRNHWYRLTINEVLLPGTPVDDPDQPIIPNPEPDDKSLGVEVEVIPWRVIDINVGQLQ